MKKKLWLTLAMFTVCVCIFALTVSAANTVASGTCGANGDNLTWTLDSEGTLTISGEGAMMDWAYGDAPWYSHRSSIKKVTIETGVTAIGRSAFYDCEALTSVTIGNSVETIGDYAFSNCTYLTSVTIADSVTSIGEWTFADCIFLTSVTIGNSVETIGNHAFRNCYRLTSVTIPDSVTSIGTGAFIYCQALASVTFGNSIETIGNYAFDSCHGLTSVTIPASVTTIGYHAFFFCTKLLNISVDANNTAYFSENGVLFNKNKTVLIQFPSKKSGAYTIPDSVTSIGDYAFHDCEALSMVTIGNSVETIGDYAFSDCTALISVTIGNSVEIIGDYAFRYCQALTSVTILSRDVVFGTTFPSGVFYGASTDRTIYGYAGSTAETYATRYGTTFFEIAHTHIYGAWIITKAASCTAAGSQYCTCTYCDATETETIPATGHSYTAGQYIDPTHPHKVYNTCACGAKQDTGNTFIMEDCAKCHPSFPLTGANMTLGNALAMNFYIPKASLDGTDYYALVTKSYADGREAAVKNIPYADWYSYSSSLWRVTFDGIAAKEMADTITVQIFDGDGNAVSEIWTDSVKAYIMRNIDGTGFNAEAKTWAVDTLNYGAASQTQFSYDTENLANADLTETHKALATQAVTLTNNRVMSVSCAGSSLVLESNISLVMYFKNIYDPTGMKAVITYTDHYGNAVEKTVAGENFRKLNSGTHGVVVDCMAAADARQPINVKVYDAKGGLNGYCTDSVEGYAQRQGGAGLYAAVMKFATSSYNMLH